MLHLKVAAAEAQKVALQTESQTLKEQLSRTQDLSKDLNESLTKCDHPSGALSQSELQPFSPTKIAIAYLEPGDRFHRPWCNHTKICSKAMGSNEKIYGDGDGL